MIEEVAAVCRCHRRSADGHGPVVGPDGSQWDERPALLRDGAQSEHAR